VTGTQGNGGNEQTVNMTEAIHLRMIPDGVRQRIHDEDEIEDGVRNEVLRRFFPSIVEETLFWAQAWQCRGIALCDSDSIHFLPEDQLRKEIADLGCMDRARLSEALDCYDPQREAIVLMKLGSWCELLLASQAEQPISLARYPAA